MHGAINYIFVNIWLQVKNESFHGISILVIYSLNSNTLTRLRAFFIFTNLSVFPFPKENGFIIYISKLENINSEKIRMQFNK